MCVRLSSADLLHAADRLKVDVVVFAGCEGSVPVAMVRLVVSHRERQRFWEIPGRELRREVIRQPGAGGALIGHGLAVTLAAAGLPSGSVRIDLLHNDLIGAVGDGQNMTANHESRQKRCLHLQQELKTLTSHVDTDDTLT